MVPNQWDPSLSPQAQAAACGPAAAVGFCRFRGIYPTLTYAVEVAAALGWTTEHGMPGPASEIELLAALRVPAKLWWGLDLSVVIGECLRGRPVILDTPAHYFEVNAYDEATGAFHAGYSGLAFRKGSRWMQISEMEALAGSVRATIMLEEV